MLSSLISSRIWLCVIRPLPLTPVVPGMHVICSGCKYTFISGHNLEFLHVAATQDQTNQVMIYWCHGLLLPFQIIFIWDIPNLTSPMSCVWPISILISPSDHAFILSLSELIIPIGHSSLNYPMPLTIIYYRSPQNHARLPLLTKRRSSQLLNVPRGTVGLSERHRDIRATITPLPILPSCLP